MWTGHELLDSAAMKEWLKDHLPQYQIPTDYVTVQEMPRNNMGKVNKKELVARLFSIKQ